MHSQKTNVLKPCSSDTKILPLIYNHNRQFNVFPGSLSLYHLTMTRPNSQKNRIVFKQLYLTSRTHINISRFTSKNITL